MKKNRIIMIGPDVSGLGGISRVLNIWQSGGFFEKFKISFVPSVSNKNNKVLTLVNALVRVFFICITGCRMVYIHTASNNSFYRKCLFMQIAILFNRPFIVHIHPSYFPKFILELQGFKQKLALLILSKAKAFVVLSQSIKREVSEIYPDKPIFILDNPIDIQGMANINDVTRRTNHILFLGWYMRRKGVYDLVDALEMLLRDNIHITADFFGTKDRDTLCSYVANKGLQEKIRINGWIGEKEKLNALYSCTMLVLPSHTEGIPNVILEAMATKTPIVSTSVGGLKDILIDGENSLIVKNNNAVDIKEKIQFMLQNPFFGRRIADSAYIEVCNRSDISIIQTRFKSMLDSIENSAGL